MLEKMGWKTGQGLGLNNDGTTSHIKIAVKDDNLGIGASQKDAETGWLNNSKSYQEVLDRLSKSCNADFAEEVKKEDEKKMKKEKETKEKKDKKEKKVKKEKISKKSKSDSTRDLNDSESLSTSTSKPTILKSAHRAKFIRNKAVSSYSEAHLKEILGGFNI
jgi:Pin2-interacting protein X1